MAAGCGLLPRARDLRAYCQGGTLQVGHTGGAPGPHPLGSLCPLRSAYQWSGVGADSCSCPAHSSICVKWECFLAVPFFLSILFPQAWPALGRELLLPHIPQTAPPFLEHE